MTQREMVDILERGMDVEVHIGYDGRLWVNIGGGCVLRVNRPSCITLIDDRNLVRGEGFEPPFGGFKDPRPTVERTPKRKNR